MRLSRRLAWHFRFAFGLNGASRNPCLGAAIPRVGRRSHDLAAGERYENDLRSIALNDCRGPVRDGAGFWRTEKGPTSADPRAYSRRPEILDCRRSLFA